MNTQIENNVNREFIPMLTQSIYKCRLISEVGAQQLLLDTAAIKSILLELPTLSNSRKSTTVPERFVYNFLFITLVDC